MKVFEIIIKIVRSKVIAILLGPEGIGIQGLYNSTIALVTGLTNFGIGTSAIKNVAEANATENTNRVAVVVTVLRRIVWITGLLGSFITLILSSFLSEMTFGNKDYTIGFIWLSITLLLNQISSGQLVLLRGMRKINYMAKSSLSGAVIGLVVSLPFYYIYGIDGIVPAIIVTSLATLLRTWYFARKVEVKKVDVSLNTTVNEGKEMVIMGFMLSITGLYVLAKSYGIRVFIGNLGGFEQVGLYTAGFSIINIYVGMIFTAMATDYFPKLSAIANDNLEVKKLINQQSEISILILSPILVIFIVFIGWITLLLYSSKFLPINSMLQWAALGMFFKATSHSIAYVFLAKGDSKLFLFNELIAGTITLFLHLLGYYLGGLKGIGIGFMVGYFYYTFQVYFLSKWKYNFSFDKEVIFLIVKHFMLLFICLLINVFISKPYNYLISSPFILLTLWVTFIDINKRIGLKSLLSKFFKR